MKQLDRIDEFLAKVIEAGVNRIVDINISNSELDSYEQQVRLLAVDNARAKADACAKRLGQKIGRAYVIREESADTPGYTSGSGSGSGDGAGFGTRRPVTCPFRKILEWGHIRPRQDFRIG